MDDNVDFHGGGRNTRVHQVQRAHATPDPSGGMNQVWMSNQRLAAMQASRPLPEVPQDTHEIEEWRLKWEHAWEVHSMGLPPAYHLDILGQRLPAALQDYLRNLRIHGR